MNEDATTVESGSDGVGSIELAVSSVASPIGSLLIAVGPSGVVRLAFENEGHDQVIASLIKDLGADIVDSPGLTAPVAAQLAEYFSGDRRDFDVPVDLRLVDGFRRRVTEALQGVGYGTTVSYRDLADRIGNPGAVRAVGSACANNPVPIIVGCHRVVRSDGKIGEYLGGTEAKAALLALESGNAA